jgi:hypothetical protein
MVLGPFSKTKGPRLLGRDPAYNVNQNEDGFPITNVGNDGKEEISVWYGVRTFITFKFSLLPVSE